MNNLVPITSSDSSLLLASLAILNQLFTHAYGAIQSKEDEVIKFLISLVQTNSQTQSPRKSKRTDDKWIPNDELDDEGKAKVFLLQSFFSNALQHPAD